MSTLVKSHLNTTNIYVRRNIVLNNLNNIEQELNASGLKGLRSNLYWQIVKLKKEQKQILSNLNKEIKRNEQAAFPFHT